MCTVLLLPGVNPIAVQYIPINQSINQLLETDVEELMPTWCQQVN
jgi:hypothetical protein